MLVLWKNSFLDIAFSGVKVWCVVFRRETIEINYKLKKKKITHAHAENNNIGGNAY